MPMTFLECRCGLTTQCMMFSLLQNFNKVYIGALHYLACEYQQAPWILFIINKRLDSSLYPDNQVNKIINSTAIIVIFRQNICLNIDVFKCIIALFSFSCSARLCDALLSSCTVALGREVLCWPGTGFLAALLMCSDKSLGSAPGWMPTRVKPIYKADISLFVCCKNQLCVLHGPCRKLRSWLLTAWNRCWDPDPVSAKLHHPACSPSGPEEA